MRYLFIPLLSLAALLAATAPLLQALANLQTAAGGAL